MDKISVSKSGKKYSVKYKIDYPEAVNERELNGINSGAISCVAAVSFDRSKKDVVLRCDFDGLVPLSEYFAGTVSKAKFIDVVFSITGTIKDCEKNYMNPNNLFLDMNCIYVQEQTGFVKLVYLPVQDNVSAVNPALFLSDLPYRIVFNNNEDNGYLTDYVEYFQHCSPFSATGLEMALSQKNEDNDNDDGTIDGRYTPPIPIPVPQPAPIPQPAPAPQPAPTSVPDDRKACLSCGNMNEADTKFCMYCGNPFENKCVIEQHLPQQAYLIRAKTNERIDINRDSFRIGKERGACDYCVSDNTTVSRNHADIIKENDHYYIVDNNSTNKTYVNLRAIPILQKVEIFSGANIRLSNEDFVFYITNLYNS